VPDRPARAGDALDQAAAFHTSSQGAKGLVCLERQHCKVVERGSRVLVEMTQGVPLDEADVERRQRRVGLSVVPHLQAFHR
jgi:hypothetical protein